MLRVALQAKKVELTDKLEKYTYKKVGVLERYIPRTARESAHAEVRLKQATVKGVKQNTCEITLHLPHENLQVSETTQHMYASVDVATVHLRHQIKSYKEKYQPSKLRHRFSRPSEPTLPT